MTSSAQIPFFALDSYQRAARIILSHHVVTRVHPDRSALPLVRRWATELREDLLELFGYRLEVTETVARLQPVIDRFDTNRPARTRSDRPFDGRRYGFLCLLLVVLGRAGEQLVLSELVDRALDEVSLVDGLSLDPEAAVDRHALVDVVAWLVDRGALTVADGDADRWATDPLVGEALFDIDRAVVAALTQFGRMPGHLASATELLGEIDPSGAPAPESERGRKAAARAVCRALVERPVVLIDDLHPAQRRHLVDGSAARRVSRLTGLTVETRAEGAALIDSSGRLSEGRFPSTGTVAQVALLLANDMAERILDPDADPLPRAARTVADEQRRYAAALDAAMPDVDDPASLAAGPTDDELPPETPDAGSTADHPVIADAWITETVDALIAGYGRTFADRWVDNAAGLRAAAIDVLERFDLARRVPGGLQILPALARYRGVVVTVRDRAETVLFSTGVPGSPAEGNNRGAAPPEGGPGGEQFDHPADDEPPADEPDDPDTDDPDTDEEMA